MTWVCRTQHILSSYISDTSGPVSNKIVGGHIGQKNVGRSRKGMCHATQTLDKCLAVPAQLKGEGGGWGVGGWGRGSRGIRGESFKTCAEPMSANERDPS